MPINPAESPSTEDSFSIPEKYDRGSAFAVQDAIYSAIQVNETYPNNPQRLEGLKNEYAVLQAVLFEVMEPKYKTLSAKLGSVSDAEGVRMYWEAANKTKALEIYDLLEQKYQPFLEACPFFGVDEVSLQTDTDSRETISVNKATTAIDSLKMRLVQAQ